MQSHHLYYYQYLFENMEKLDIQNKRSTIAINDMCTFAVVNMAIAPLFPIVIVQIRQQLGSADPYSVILPSTITAIATILVSIAACKYFERRN